MRDPKHDNWPKNDDDAAARAAQYLNNDPLPGIPDALLGSAAFAEYAKITGMVYPFKGFDREKKVFKDGLVKPASYEVRPGDSFFFFDKEGVRKHIDIGGSGHNRHINLQANSITFCSTDERFRLPSYIAMRFNLRIKHVHRGILLGTGPIVDPGFNKKLLIPLHNLTDSEYVISLDEGLIWVEFTKTYLWTQSGVTSSLPDVPLPLNTQKDFNKFFMEASGGLPIRSSIPTAIKLAEDRADYAITLVEKLESRIQTMSVIGIVTAVIALFAIVIPVLQLIETIVNK